MYIYHSVCMYAFHAQYFNSQLRDVCTPFCFILVLNSLSIIHTKSTLDIGPILIMYQSITNQSQLFTPQLELETPSPSKVCLGRSLRNAARLPKHYTHAQTYTHEHNQCNKHYPNQTRTERVPSRSGKHHTYTHIHNPHIDLADTVPKRARRRNGREAAWLANYIHTHAIHTSI